MNTPIEHLLTYSISQAFSDIYQADVPQAQLHLEMTNKDFAGDYTFVVFPYLKTSRKKPEDTAQDIGNYLKQHVPQVAGFNVVKGFLNIVVADSYWTQFLENNHSNTEFGRLNTGKGRKVMVEYSSPNTNKPLHLGHVRNNLLGYSVAQLLRFSGHEVIKANLVNDRGIHICKSMLAWQMLGNGETPASSGLKGDHLVGKYYVEFDKAYKAEVDGLVAGGMDKEEAEKKAPLMLKAQEMLRQWEAGDEDVVNLWKTMNGWVYDGFDVTYKRLGVDFDKFYYESQTYLLGKDLVQEGLDKGVFYRKDDGSVWVDLTAQGLDHKLLLRGDGTSVYITQDLGTADLKYREFHCEKSMYVVANEQEYHFKVLRQILQLLEKPYADGIYHLSYGMVELPEGKMKSREGTVVDADQLMDEMHTTAAQITNELGKTEGFNADELDKLIESIGLGALKYFLLKVDPIKKMLFNPKESIDFQGNTGPFVQYTHARLCSLLRNADIENYSFTASLPESLHPLEKDLVTWLHRFPAAVEEAANLYSPALICNYVYELARLYNRFYYELSVLKEEDATNRSFRLKMSQATVNTLRNSLGLLGMAAPEKM